MEALTTTQDTLMPIPSSRLGHGAHDLDWTIVHSLNDVGYADAKADPLQ